jgi:hypothetical protein
MSQQLVKSRMGRVVLHALCLLRNRRQRAWHWQGMLREFHVSRTGA